jgi:putative exosortase-associated protein (TIGR04073 family)
MKIILKALLMLTLLVSYNASASSYASRLGGKIGNGIANSVTGIAEIPKTIIIANRREGVAYAATAGVVTGILHMVGRTLSGAYDLATFVIPTKPIVTPDYIWQDFGKETSYRSTWELR